MQYANLEQPENIERLLGLLSRDRRDPLLEEFISTFPNPVFTVDREDGADEEYIEFKDRGLALRFEQDSLVSIFLQSEAKSEDYRSYFEPLPFGLDFSRSTQDVVDAIGNPASRGGGHQGYFGYVAPWVRYEFEEHLIHFQFSPQTEKIQLVTLMPRIDVGEQGVAPNA